MWTLSGFADEISPDFDEQCRFLVELGMTHLELRSAWGVNVCELDADQVDRIEGSLREYGLSVSCIGSPIGKIGLQDDFDEHLRRFVRCAAIGSRLGAPFVRIFSFRVSEPGRAADREIVVRRLSTLAQKAAEAGVVLLHENETGMYGDTPERCLDLVKSVDSTALRLTWDPANYVAAGLRPYDDAYAIVRPYVDYLQIKDKVRVTDTVVAAGEGDGQIPQTLSALREDGFDGVFSLEPHLGHSPTGAPFSGPDLFRYAHDAFTGLLTRESIAYR
jgi:sugar phosphate isomerase/epimerase